MENKVKQIIADVLNVEVSELNGNSSPDNIDVWDSLNQMNIIVALEEGFNIMFSDEQIIEMLNIDLIILAVSEQVK